MSHKHCLIVDDSDVIRRILKHMLGALQFETSEAGNGQEALDCCRRSMPDAILLDWTMPVVGGIDCLQALRQLPGGEKPVVLYCITENDVLEIFKAMRAGADDILLKPFDRGMLRQKLSSAGLM